MAIPESIVGKLKLVQVQTFFRHGARTPLHNIRGLFTDKPWCPSITIDPTETAIPFELRDISSNEIVKDTSVDNQYRQFKLPGGESIGMLTSAGEIQASNLGARLRETYAEKLNLLSCTPKPSEFHCRSTCVSRTFKSMRGLIAGFMGRHVEEPIQIYTTPFSSDYLYPNPEICPPMYKLFVEGIQTLNNSTQLKDIKKRLLNKLKISQFVDEIDRGRNQCPLYYVLDVFQSRKFHGFTVPNITEIDDDLCKISTVEFVSEMMGSKINWMNNLDFVAGPLINTILSHMSDHLNLPRMLFHAVHDSSLIPLLIALDHFDERWPPFCADIVFELYKEARPVPLLSSQKSKLDATLNQFEATNQDASLEGLWVRVTYLNRPVPLNEYWGLGGRLEVADEVNKVDSSFIPLHLLTKKWSNFRVPIEHFASYCLKHDSRIELPTLSKHTC